MKNKLMMLVITLMALATPMLAQGQAGGATGNPSDDYRRAAAYIALGLAAGLCGLGQGKATASAAEAIARNPGAIAGIRFVFIFGLVLIESLGLYALVVTFIAR
jgi:F-type H+-transporting ATPase subunit c